MLQPQDLDKNAEGQITENSENDDVAQPECTENSQDNSEPKCTENYQNKSKPKCTEKSQDVCEGNGVDKLGCDEYERMSFCE